MRRTAQGSRELGTWPSSSLVRVVPVPTFLVSTTGVSDVTVTVSSTVVTFKGKVTSTLVPVLTISERSWVEKPAREMRTL